MNFSVGWPLALWGLLALPLFMLFVTKSRAGMSQGRVVAVTITRMLAFTALVLAAADLRIGWPSDELAVATIVDTSESVSAGETEQIQTSLRGLAAQHSEVKFIDTNAATTREGVESDADLARQINLATALLPRDRARRILLATDGRDVSPDVRVAIQQARAAGVEVSAHGIGDSPTIDAVSIVGLDVPRLVRAGEELDIGARLFAADARATKLTASLNGAQKAESTTTTLPGESAHPLTVEFPEEEGVYRLEVNAAAEGDRRTENNSWSTLVRVVPRPKVMLIHSPQVPSPALATVLTDAELRVDSRVPTAVPTDLNAYEDHSLVIIDEVKLNDLTEPQQVAIRTWVEARGGGLITITGNNPVRREPSTLREIEPIKRPPAIPEPRPLELILCIDRSGSMSGGKMAMARRAGVAAIQALRADARVGALAFSHGVNGAVQPVPVAEAENVANFIRSIGANGGTDISAALRTARRMVSPDPRYIHHVVLLSDGASEPASAIAAAQALASAGASITAITIGPYSELMAEIARIGRGRYHVTSSAASLPRLFIREAQFRQPPAHRRGRFRPEIETRLPMISELQLGAGAELAGHALAAPRQGADTVLKVSGGWPIFAHWYRELGQVGTFTSNTSGGWADRWRTEESFRDFWSGVAWGMLRTRTVDPVDLRVTRKPGDSSMAIVTVAGPTLAAFPRPWVGMARGPGPTSPLELSEAGPGLWRAEVPVESGFIVDGMLPGEPAPTVAVTADRPYPKELGRFGVDPGMVDELAAVGGGQRLASLPDILAEVEEQPAAQGLRLPLLATALFLYLLGVLLTRLPDDRSRKRSRHKTQRAKAGQAAEQRAASRQSSGKKAA